MTADRTIDLEDEFAAAKAALPAFEHRIRPRVSAAIWNAPASLLGVMSCEFDGGSWQPWAHPHHVTGGTLALLVACRADDDEEHDFTAPVPRAMALEGPAIVDLVAIPLHAPHRWARRTGLARVLGRIPYMQPRAEVRIYRSPASWLKGDGSGIALLERERGGIASILQSCTGGILADDAEHAHDLAAIASRPMPAPMIRPAGTVARAAA